MIEKLFTCPCAFLPSCCPQREIMCTVLNVSPSGLEEAVRQRVNGNKVVLQTVQELVVVQLG